MKKGYLIVSLILMGFLFMNCGSNSTGGSPGSSGSEETGILIQSVSIAGNPTSTDLTPDIDVNVHYCDEEHTTQEDGLFRVDATITINAGLVNTLYDTFPATVEECTITYLKVNEDPASPILEEQTIYPNCPLIDGANSCDVLLIDIERKVDYWTAVWNGLNLPAEYPTKYVASYKCKYYNQFRKSGTFQVEYMIFLADFDTC